MDWDRECKRCGIGCTHDYCMDCQNMGYDPSCTNYKYNEKMKLESLNDNGSKAKAKSPPVIPEDNFNTFNEGDTVMLKSTLQRYSNDLKRIAGVELEVVKCFTRDLGDGVKAEIVYLKGDHVQNPYLAEHFKRVL